MALQLRMLTSLAFFPPQDIVREFSAVSNENRKSFGNIAEELLVYFEDTYFGRFRLDAPRGNPVFLIELWKMFHRIDAELPQTNNRVKGWHRSFQGLLSSSYPSFWKFLRAKKNDELVSQLTYYTYRVARRPTTKNPLCLFFFLQYDTHN